MWKFHLTSLAVAGAALVLAPSVADSRPNGVRAGARTNIHAGGGHIDRANMSRPANVNRQGVVDRRNSGNTIARGGNNRINTGDINVNVDHDHDNGWDWDDHRHPIAAGVAFGTAAAVTSAAIGARYYSLPPACSPYAYGGLSYYSCGGIYYAPRYEGDTVVYIVVDRPG